MSQVSQLKCRSYKATIVDRCPTHRRRDRCKHRHRHKQTTGADEKVDGSAHDETSTLTKIQTQADIEAEKEIEATMVTTMDGMSRKRLSRPWATPWRTPRKRSHKAPEVGRGSPKIGRNIAKPRPGRTMVLSAPFPWPDRLRPSTWGSAATSGAGGTCARPSACCVRTTPVEVGATHSSDLLRTMSSEYRVKKRPPQNDCSEGPNQP